MKPVIVICDIFGRTQAFDTLCRHLPGKVSPVDPYGGRNMGFATEAQAYEYFMAHAGLEAYADQIFNLISNLKYQISVIAFSVGAASLWKICGRPELSHIKKAVFFYGSQIRNFPQITPVFEARLIFPDFEPHFNVDDLIKNLEYKKGVTCTKAQGRHGFMNEHSRNFDPRLYQKYLGECISDLK